MASEIVSQNKEMTQSNCFQWNLQTIGDIEVIQHIGMFYFEQGPMGHYRSFFTKSNQVVINQGFILLKKNKIGMYNLADFP